MVAAEHPAGAAEARDHFVGDEDGADLPSQFTHAIEEAGGRRHVAVGALNGLNDDGGDGSGRLAFDHFTQEFQAVRAAVMRLLRAEGALAAVGVGR